MVRFRQADWLTIADAAGAEERGREGIGPTYGGWPADDAGRGRGLEGEDVGDLEVGVGVGEGGAPLGD